MKATALYRKYLTKMQKIADVKYASAVLQWDQETYLPAKGQSIRGQQIATLSELAHREFTDKKLGALLLQLQEADALSDREKRNVQLSLEDYEKNKKFTGAFVRKMSEAVNTSFHAWMRARKENDFSLFQQPLDKLIQLKKQEAEILGYPHQPYDALLNDHDKGLSTARVDELFGELIPKLSKLMEQVQKMPAPDTRFLTQYFNKETQWKFGIEMLKRIHYDFEAGRQDISAHPFTTNFNAGDVRITTRIDEHDFMNMTWSCLHEGGHALYEQGLPESEYGLPLGEYASISIHESQSRLWENCIGRSLPFWEQYFPLLCSYFPEQFKGVSLAQFYAAINCIQPSLIRTEADELSYHFHVLIRFEIEKMLIAGTISTKDIPACWNELYHKHLGINVPDDNQGCLQDVHWSHGSFGYFPTYSLGSLYATQWHAALNRENASFEKLVAAGDTSFILTWLRQQIFPFGRYYDSNALCQKATGEKLDSNYFIQYATKKLDSFITS